MNILIVSHTYTPEVGAAPSRLASMARGLRGKGVGVSVLTSLPSYPKGRVFDGYRMRMSKREMIDDIDVFRYWIYASVSKKALPRALNMFSLAFTIWMFAFKFRKIRSFDRIIIQSPSLPVACSAIVLFKWLYRKKVVLNVSDLWPLTAVELGAMSEGEMSYKAMLWMERFLYKNSDAIQGQSNEIIEYIKDYEPNKRYFLYRNLQPKSEIAKSVVEERATLKIVYAGLLGVAQDILMLMKSTDFKELGAEFHIYGGGNQVESILDYIKDRDLNVFYHGIIEKKDIAATLVQYHTSIVPLTSAIRGAVPSKIFDLVSIGVPILFCGGGEGANIVKEYNIGLVSEPSDYNALKNNILKIKEMPLADYEKMVSNCIAASKSDFSFEYQMKEYYEFLNYVSCI